jgi:hypothetical protein
MAAKLQSPAVHSARLATKKALEIKSFMEEKIAAGHLQAQQNRMNLVEKQEAKEKDKKERNATEQKLAQKVAKDKKEQTTSGLAGLLKKSV